MGTLLLGWIWLAAAVFLLCCVWRALKFSRAPVHLRWDLYPVAHEASPHGGSYLEKKDWWDKPRKKSKWGEISAMGSEILLMKGVWENNRNLWWGSALFHWGLYLLSAVTIGLVIAGLGFVAGWWQSLLMWAGTLGGVLTAIGALILLVMRSTDRKLKPYTTPLDRLNLALLVVLGVLSTMVATAPAGMLGVIDAMGRILRLKVPEVTTLLAAQMVVGALFLLYMPFTRMVHFFSKYFTYHKIRWDDKPVTPGSELDRRLDEARNFGVTWSAAHVGSGSWVDVATTIPEEKDGE